MTILNANTTENNLATEIGDPNTLTINYSTDILLPVEGPHFFADIIVSFKGLLLELNEFLLLIDVLAEFLDKGVSFGDLLDKTEQAPNPHPPSRKFDKEFAPIIQQTIVTQSIVRPPSIFWSFFGFSNSSRDQEWKNAKRQVLEWLSRPNRIARDAYDSGIISLNHKTIILESLLKANFNNRCEIILTRFIELYGDIVPNNINDTIKDMISKAFELAKRAHPSFLYTQFSNLPDAIFTLLGRWLIARYLYGKGSTSDSDIDEVIELLGFRPLFSVKEWAFRREERLIMEFGSPDIRGPLKTEAVPPQGYYEYEEYQSMENELVTVSAQTRGETTQEISSQLRDRLNSIYYAGQGSVAELTGSGSSLSLSEDRRNSVLSILHQVSIQNSSIFSESSVTNKSVTTHYQIPGVDQSKSCTIHRFKVALPIDSRVELYDVGLTWTPRILNPFMALRQVIRQIYEDTIQQYIDQYYVSIPVEPPVVWEKYTATKDVLIEEGAIFGTASVNKSFSINVNPTPGRFDKPDFSNATVSWSQNESFFNDDPDTWSIWLINLSYSNGTISGRIRMETTDGGADFDGTAHVEIPMLRWSEESVSAMSTFEAQQQEYELKKQAITAQAHQYAKIKQREVIEKHERLDPIIKIVFEELMKRSCSPGTGMNLSYYTEIIKRCINWRAAKIVFESADMSSLNYPEYPPDHFMNSMAVRLFLPINRTSESLLLDTLEECGSLFMRASVDTIRDKIDEKRDELSENGAETLDEFSTWVVIGDHLEAVLSKFEHSS